MRVRMGTRMNIGNKMIFEVQTENFGNDVWVCVCVCVQVPLLK